MLREKDRLNTDPIDALAEFILANYWRIELSKKSSLPKVPDAHDSTPHRDHRKALKLLQGQTTN